MSRPTNTERGARLAYEIAQEQLQQLFPGQLPREFWEAISDEATVTIAECSWARDTLELSRRSDASPWACYRDADGYLDIEAMAPCDQVALYESVQ